MNCNEIREKLAALVIEESELTPAMRQHMTECKGCSDEFSDMKRMWFALAEVPTPEPSHTSAQRFDQWLAQEAKSARKPARVDIFAGLRTLLGQRAVWQVAVVLGCVGLGFLGGEFRARQEFQQKEVARMQGEMDSMKQMLAVSMLQQQSASERLRGASMVSELRQPDSQVVEQLISTLEDDDNINVRLAAVESLGSVANNADTRKRLVEALGRQNSPTVQLALLAMLVELREKSVVPVARRIAMDENNPLIRQRVEQLLGKLTKQ